MMKPYLLAISALLLLAACNNPEQAKEDSRVDKLPYYKDATFTPHWFEGDPPAAFHRIPNFSFINQDGASVTDKTFSGKIYVTDFFFTSCPGICPKMTANMHVLQEEFLDDPDVMLLSHSVTPTKDSVPILKNYAEAKEVNVNKWHLVTGARDEIYAMGRKAYFVEEDLGINKSPDAFLHTENFVLIDENKFIRGIYNGLNKTSVNQLIKDIQLLKQEG